VPQTLVAHGIGKELAGQGVACNALWPATMVESFATINFQMGTPELWRKASILADATLKIVQEGAQ
jgi:citronellol/citronellal dehydrogenase